MAEAEPRLRRRLPARLSVFGSPGRAVTLEVTPRPRTLRAARAIASGGIALVAAPFAALLPPHLPWALALIGVGAWRARAEWRGDYELHAFEGACPRCGAKLTVNERYITLPHPVPCYECHAQPLLTAEK
jgi:hypothetical protein